ncbi:hypothetical protein ACFL1G_09570 [Planctomycetota bacterium]
MKTLRICLNAFVLTAANLGSIIAGFILYNLLKPANQIAVQGSVAAILSITAFLLWSWLILHLQFRKLILQEPIEFFWAYVASLFWFPTIFIPVHYVTQGYLTSIGNIIAVLLFQIPVNGVSIAVVILMSSSYKISPVINSKTGDC